MQQYRIDRSNNIFIRLNDDGSTLMIKSEFNNGKIRHTRSWVNDSNDWIMIYNNYSRSDKFEFEKAESEAQI